MGFFRRLVNNKILKKKIDKATYNALLAKYPDADETEIKLMVKGNAKKLYKYGLDNEKPWIWLTETSIKGSNPDIEDIQGAMDIVRIL